MTSNQSRPVQRELVYCHACREEWYRDEHGLVCPRSTCGSDAVEIIEENSDPRSDRGGFTFHHTFNDAGDDDDDNENDHRHRASATLFHFGGPGLRVTSAQRGFRSTRSSDQPPRQGSAGSAGPDDDIPLVATEDMMNMFTTIVQTLVGPVASPGQPPHRPGEGGPPQPPGADEHNHTRSHAHAHAHAHMFGPAGFGGSERFFYDSGARLSPRDADAPQPAGEPRVVDLAAYVTAAITFEILIVSLSAIAASEGGGPALGPGPGGLLARLMGMPPGTEGDFVYTQAQLDRVLSQLMEQHQGNAPPPASREAIESLPKVKVTRQMVIDGDDCAICKEELVMDEEVSQLPCKHCYHFQCVSRWLEEHDTCPICRHPITPGDPRQPPQPPNAQQPRSTVWPFNTSTLRPPNESQSPGGSSSPGNGSNSGSRSSGGSRLADLFRRNNGDRSS
ncbi:unnamed protein product [Tuber aestivum]|uniref:RING-type E3 ubiquitin transferase n=1 Tax=Tuber aestivum TaxID=59557 RepID=A0A292PNJ6_9PEZI|nr:unnamed protein product [Tuber aestivum]